MTEASPPLGVRLMSALTRDPDWSAMRADELVALREAVNRKRSSRLARLITGFPDRGATIRWQQIELADRTLRVRTYRPSGTETDGLPLVLHVHGGGFVGTAVQSDWVNSHLAARLPALVVSVEHRLLDEQTPLQAVIDDGWDVLRYVTEHGDVDPERTAVFGESTGAMVAAMAAIRARDSGIALRAQVLVNPPADLTAAGFDYPSMRRHADSPTLTLPQMRLFQRLAVPPGTDPRSVSPVHAEDLSGLVPALVVVPTVDPVADHGRGYAERLRAAGTPTKLVEYPGAPHGFLSMPGLVPQARAARTVITEFLHEAVRR